MYSHRTHGWNKGDSSINVIFCVISISLKSLFFVDYFAVHTKNGSSVEIQILHRAIIKQAI